MDNVSRYPVGSLNSSAYKISNATIDVKGVMTLMTLVAKQLVSYLLRHSKTSRDCSEVFLFVISISAEARL